MYNIQIAVNLTSQAAKGQRIGYAGGGSSQGGEGVGSKSRKKVFSGVFWHSWVFLWKAWKAKHCQHLGDHRVTATGVPWEKAVVREVSLVPARNSYSEIHYRHLIHK